MGEAIGAGTRAAPRRSRPRGGRLHSASYRTRPGSTRRKTPSLAELIQPDDRLAAAATSSATMIHAPGGHQAERCGLHRALGPRAAPAGRGMVGKNIPEGLNVVRDKPGLASLVFHVGIDQLAGWRTAIGHPRGAGPRDAAGAGPTGVLWPAIGRFLTGRRGYQSNPYAVLAARSHQMIEGGGGGLAWSFVPRWSMKKNHLETLKSLELRRVHPAAGGLVRRTGARRLRQRLAAPADRPPPPLIESEREHSGGTGPPQAVACWPSRWTGAAADLHQQKNWPPAR